MQMRVSSAPASPLAATPRSVASEPVEDEVESGEERRFAFGFLEVGADRYEGRRDLRNPRDFGAGEVGFDSPADGRYAAMLALRDVNETPGSPSLSPSSATQA